MRKSVHLAGLEKTGSVAFKVCSGLCIVKYWWFTVATLAPFISAPLSLAAGSHDNEPLMMLLYGSQSKAPLQMLEYDPDKRITAREALRHEFFRVEPALPAVDLRASVSDELTEHAPEKEPSISHAEPANAAVVGLCTSGKPGSSQVQSHASLLLSCCTTSTPIISYHQSHQSGAAIYLESAYERQSIICHTHDQQIVYDCQYCLQSIQVSAGT